jgi:hypothetical protein
MNTIEHANTMAEMAIDILYSEGNPFKEPIDKSRLQWEIRQATLKKLVIEDSDVLDEEEFQECVNNSKIQKV